MRSLFLAWQAPNRSWFPIGRLDADKQHYEFGYTKGALLAKREVGFDALPAFPDLRRRYVSPELFPLFKNRVVDPSRKNFAEYLDSLGLDRTSDPIEILSLTGGERQTDSFEVFPKIEKRSDNTFSCRFFLHGLRHVSAAAQSRAEFLKPGDDLGVSLELNNPKTVGAIQLTAREDYLILGWAPHYLVSDLIHAIFENPLVTAKVVRVNPSGVPAFRRILIEFGGRLPAKFEPMSSARFQLIPESKTRTRKASARRH